MDSEEGCIFLGQKIRKEIKDKTLLTASGGIACNKLLAKICGEVNKPDGLTYLPSSVPDILAFLRQKPVRCLPGIGKVNEMILSGIGVNNCGDVIERANEIYINFSPNAFQFLIQGALGITRVVHENSIQKSIGVSQTFHAIFEYDEYFQKTKVMANELFERLNESQLMAKTMTIEIKTTKFDVK